MIKIDPYLLKYIGIQTNPPTSITSDLNSLTILKQPLDSRWCVPTCMDIILAAAKRMFDIKSVEVVLKRAMVYDNGTRYKSFFNYIKGGKIDELIRIGYPYLEPLDDIEPEMITKFINGALERGHDPKYKRIFAYNPEKCPSGTSDSYKWSYTLQLFYELQQFFRNDSATVIAARVSNKNSGEPHQILFVGVDTSNGDLLMYDPIISYNVVQDGYGYAPDMNGFQVNELLRVSRKDFKPHVDRFGRYVLNFVTFPRLVERNLDNVFVMSVRSIVMCCLTSLASQMQVPRKMRLTER